MFLEAAVGRVREISACPDGFPACPHSRVFSRFTVGALGTGDRKCDSGRYENSPMCLISPAPRFRLISFSTRAVIVSDGNFFPYPKGYKLQRVQLPGQCSRGTMTIVRSHTQGLQHWEMAENARKSMNGLPGCLELIKSFFLPLLKTPMEVKGISVWFISKGRLVEKKIVNIIQVAPYWLIFRAKHLSCSKTFLFHISKRTGDGI